MKKKNICVVTGSRAEYGLLFQTLKKIQKSSKLNLSLIVTGMHLSKKYGNTYKEIEKDNFKINYKVNLFFKENSHLEISKSTGEGIKKISEAYHNLKPDIVLVLGDRYEIFSAASAAMLMNIPIAHIHGGELTLGLIDDAIRHSITKMSHLHFVTTKSYKKRIIQLGENKKNIFHVGAPGIENIYKLKLMKKQDIEESLGTKFNKKNLLITFHPVTLQNHLSVIYFRNLLLSLDKLKNTNLYFTKANADTNGMKINIMINNFIKDRKNAFCYSSLGQVKYLSLMNLVDGVVGNSSSGLIEAPSLKVGTLNIGDRQDGRVRSDSVIDCGYEQRQIQKGLKSLFSLEFKNLVKKQKNPYFKKETSHNILKVLENTDFDNLLHKKFIDITNS